MDQTKYSIDGAGRIRPVDGSQWTVELSEIPGLSNFEEALAYMGKQAVAGAQLGALKELWVGELIEVQLLDIEQGASLVTALNCQRGNRLFGWRGETFYTHRPDFGHLLITTGLKERRLNRIETALFSKMFDNHRTAIYSLHRALTLNQLNPLDAHPFLWWVDFWKVRGIPIHQGPEVGFTLRRAAEQLNSPPHAIAAAPKDRGGAPRQYDWDAFDAEVVRIADLDGLPERPALMKQMQEWCVATWGKEPAASKIRERLAKLTRRSKLPD
jgi:hypothetical protein